MAVPLSRRTTRQQAPVPVGLLEEVLARALSLDEGEAQEFCMRGWLEAEERSLLDVSDGQALAHGLVLQTVRHLGGKVGADDPFAMAAIEALTQRLSVLSTGQPALPLQPVAVHARAFAHKDESPEVLRLRLWLATFESSMGAYDTARVQQEAVLEARERLLGAEHPDTSVGAWNLFTTSAAMNDGEAMVAVLQAHLAWLLSASPPRLTGDQRVIREQLQDLLARGQRDPA